MRIIFGPLPRPVCMVGIFLKNFYMHALAMNQFFKVCFKFSVAFYFKSMPIMDDNFLNLFLNLVYTVISSVIIFAKFYSPGRPVFNEVRLIKSIGQKGCY